MNISTVDHYRGPIVLAIIVPVLLLCIDASAFGQSDEKNLIRISNLDWKVQGDVAVITYDLDAPPNETYAVSIVLLNENDPSVKFVPKSVSGDCGEVGISGKGKVIRWEFRKDVAVDLSGEGYYFEISVEKAGGGLWLYLALGAAAGGAAALLLLKKKEETTSATRPVLPEPPLRP